MRTIFVLLIVVVAVQCKSQSAQLGKFLQTVVYSGHRCEIDRHVHLSDSLSANEYHTVSVHGFSEKVEDGSIRLKTQSNGVEILDVKLSSMAVSRRHLPEYLELLSKLENKQIALNETLLGLRLEHARLESHLRSVEEFVHHSIVSSDAKTRLPVSEVSELLAFKAKEQDTSNAAMARLTKRILEEEKQLSDVEKKLIKLRQEHGDQNIGGIYLPAHETEKVLTFRVMLTESKPSLDFVISYMTSTASWSPEYDIRIESKNSSIDSRVDDGGRNKLYTMSIDYFANVVQSTGEHWADTPLILSTANPTYIPPHPEAYSQGVQIQKPVQRHAYGKSGNAQMHKFAHGGEGSSGNVIAGATGSGNIGFAGRAVSEAPEEALDAFYEESSFDFGAPMNMASMPMLQSRGVSSGDLGASHKFHIQYPVSIDSVDLLAKSLPTGSIFPSLKHLILVDRVQVDAKLFTFAVPSQDTTGHLLGWGQYNTSSSITTAAGMDECSSVADSRCTVSSGDVSSLSPLLSSHQARVHIQGDNVGTVHFNTVQPSDMIRLNLGSDNHIHITSQRVMPEFKGEQEDKSTWFTVDKKQFRVKTEERTTTIRSSYSSAADGSAESHLVIVSENLPKSLETDEVSVELLSSSLKSAVSLGGDAAGSSNDECIEAILTRETAVGAATSKATQTLYHNKHSGHLYWAVWLKAGESVTIPFKYKITWPAEKSIGWCDLTCCI